MAMADSTLGAFLDDLGSRSPVPGGGAAAAVTAAIAAALGRMVVAWSDTDPAEGHAELLEKIDAVRNALVALADTDAKAYASLAALMKLDRDEPERTRSWDAAVEDAIAAPRAVIEACRTLLKVLEVFRPRTNKRLAGDLAGAGLLADAAARTAAESLRANLPLLSDPDRAAALGDESTSSLAECHQRATRLADEPDALA